jgi:protein-L-isoaspartate(D-aspartate) O-methyltransferase
MTKKLEDTWLHKGLRNKMIQSLEKKGIQNLKLLQIMGRIPRHFFLDGAFDVQAYKDKPFSIGCGQTISQPYTVAYQTSLVDPQPEDIILEIGTGSGYQAVVLAAFGCQIHSIERFESLFNQTTSLLKNFDLPNLHTYLGDGNEGLLSIAPFDKIIVTCGATEVPHNLIHQLKIKGFIIIPIGDENVQKMTKITRMDAINCKFEQFDNFAFVPFLSGTASIND